MAKRKKYHYFKQRICPRKKFSKKQREFVFKRDGYKCQLCGVDLKNNPDDRVLDHKIPLSKYGTNEFHNIWLLCDTCDKKKKANILDRSIDDRINYLVEKHKYLKHAV
jgi:5-methylcytosine-specific restriction endonuclease McrA